MPRGSVGRTVRALSPLAALLALALGCDGGTIHSAVDADATAPLDAADVASDLSPCQPCSVWEVRCGSRCVDLTGSPENCGACGVRCDLRTQVCRSGVCMTVASRCGSVIPDAGGDGGSDAARSDGSDVASGDVADAGVEDGGFRAEYYARPDLTRLRVARVDRRIDFDWSMAAPASGVPRESFSARWTAILRPRVSDSYTLVTSTDDGVRLWLNDELLIDDWNPHGVMENRATARLAAGADYVLRVEYFNGSGGGSARLSWETATMTREVIPAGVLTPVSGVDFGCEEGVCCPSGGAVPVCCPSGTRCVQRPRFMGCCPMGEACGEDPMCVSVP